MAACENEHSPVQLVPLLSIGTPAVHDGVDGGLFQWTPWGTEGLEFVKVTDSAVVTLAVFGVHAVVEFVPSIVDSAA